MMRLWGVKEEMSHTVVTFSRSASEEVGESGLLGLKEGELPALDTYSGSGTYRTCKHNRSVTLYKHQPWQPATACMDTQSIHTYLILLM